MKFFACIIGITIILISSTAARVFEDKYGRIINAQLVSHSGPAADRIKINKGGKEMNVKVDVFSKKRSGVYPQLDEKYAANSRLCF